MGNFVEFIKEINQKIGISLPASWANLSEVCLAQRFLEKLNEYFFQTYEKIGTTTFNGQELQYFSKFHKFWEANHKEILNVKIDREKAQLAAEALSKAIKQYGNNILGVANQPQGLSPEAVAQVRFFTANQDFREPPENQFDKYFDDPSRFEAQEIAEDPESFLKFLGMTRLSQTDKRIDFAKNAAKFLLEKNITAFEIARYYNNDAVRVREGLVNASNIGYGFKKANMYLRDMYEWNIWPRLNNLDQIDVASDINTIKLALRTGILKTDIQLLSSFLDIFCYQYSYIDEMSSKAWRVVWEKWTKLDSTTAPLSPCQMDYLIYRIGREYCKPNVVKYECENGHTFYHFGARLKKCPECGKKGINKQAIPKYKLIPCQLNSSQLPHHNGEIFLRGDNLLKTFNGFCIFEDVCQPKAEKFIALNPPKSISIKGQTSWTNSYAYQEKGGGGMMG